MKDILYNPTSPLSKSRADQAKKALHELNVIEEVQQKKQLDFVT